MNNSSNRRTNQPQRYTNAQPRFPYRRDGSGSRGGRGGRGGRGFGHSKRLGRAEARSEQSTDAVVSVASFENVLFQSLGDFQRASVTKAVLMRHLGSNSLESPSLDSPPLEHNHNAVQLASGAATALPSARTRKALQMHETRWSASVDTVSKLQPEQQQPVLAAQQRQVEPRVADSTDEAADGALNAQGEQSSDAVQQIGRQKDGKGRTESLTDSRPDSRTEHGQEREPRSEVRGNASWQRMRQSEAEERFIEEELDPRTRYETWRERKRAEHALKKVELPEIFTLKTFYAKRSAERTTEETSKPQPSKNQSSKKASHRSRGAVVEPLTAQTLPSARESHSLRDVLQQAAQPPVHAVRATATAFLVEHGLMQRDTTIVCAVSGGVDSVVLLDALCALSVQHGLHIVIAHCNHKLRGEASDADEKFVHQAAKRYGCTLYSASVDVRGYAHAHRLSIETAARHLRYQFLEFVAFKSRAHAVATAHTLNDSVETFVMNLVRGTGLTGLSGIAPSRTFGQKSSLVRPFLKLRKEDLVQYAHALKLVWREDETNEWLQYTRNKVRHDLLPKLEADYSPAIMDVLQRTSSIVREADALVMAAVERALPAIVEDVETYLPNYLALKISTLIIHSPFLQAEIVHRAVQDKFTPQFGQMLLSFDAVERIVKLINAEFTTKADVNKYLYAVRDRESIVIAPKLPIIGLNAKVEKNNEYDFGGWRIILREVERHKVRFTADPAVEFFDSDLLPYRMTLRTWQHGDVLKPYGMSGTVKISDYLTNSKSTFIQRQHALVLATNDDVVWLCGMRMSDAYKVTDATTRVLRVEYRPKKNPPMPQPDSTFHQAAPQEFVGQQRAQRGQAGHRGRQSSSAQSGTPRSPQRSPRPSERSNERINERERIPERPNERTRERNGKTSAAPKKRPSRASARRR